MSKVVVSRAALALAIQILERNAIRHNQPTMYEAAEELRKSAIDIEDIIPEGCKIVPVEPTLEMVMAGERAFDDHLHVRVMAKGMAPWPSEETHELCQRVSYRAMLVVSPEIKL